jgi:Cu(I)/Ag(I) efflux system membrane protein CusA/SilA
VPEVANVFGKIGRADTATDPAPLTMIETFIQLKPRSEWRTGITMADLVAELDARVDIPGLTNAWVMPIKTRIDMLATGIKTPVGVKISGRDLSEIQKIGQRLERILETVPGTASVYSERVVGGRYGLNIADVQQVIATAIGGTNVARTVEGLERYPINLRYPQDYRDSPERLAELPVVTPNGARIALADVTRITITDGPPSIKSENARPNGWTFVDIEDVDVGTYVQNAMRVVRERLELPPGYSLNWSGQYEYMLRAQERLGVVVPFILAIIVLLLYVHFQRVGEVVMILATLPVAAAGAVWLMFLLDYNLSVAVAVGFIALTGVAVELSVIMLTYLNQAYAESLEGSASRGQEITKAELHSAVRQGSLRRVRPVVMTAVSTIAGLLPLMYSSGTGAEVLSRIAAPMVGGMTTALLLTLIVLPAAFLLWKGRRIGN